MRHRMHHASLTRYFNPWDGMEKRSCWTCVASVGYDGNHLWCRRHELVVVMPCGLWEREAGCDEPESEVPGLGGLR